MFAVSALTSTTSYGQQPTELNSQFLFEIKNTCIVRFDDSISKFDVTGKARGLLASANARAKHLYSNTIKGFAVNMDCNKAKAAFAHSADALSFSPDGLVVGFPKPDKPGGGKGGGDTQPEPQETPWSVDRVGGSTNWNGQITRAWVLDTGIDLDHGDLNVNASLGMSVFTDKRNARLDDGHGHGTHVAGIIAAIDNEQDVVGVAAGAEVVPIKVLNSRGSGSYAGIIAGIDYVANNAEAGDCANMSLGGGYSKDVNDAVIAAASTGIYFVVAAGNETQNTDNVSPASADGNNVYTIASTNQGDGLSSFSNYGTSVDYAAPGGSILSLKKGGGTTTMSGTSMASPAACAVIMVTGGFPNIDGDASAAPDGTQYPIIHNLNTFL